MEEAPLQFIETWDSWGQILGIISLSIFAGYLFIHLLKLVTTSDSKQKYDYIIKNEIGILWKSAVFFILGGAILTNSFIDEIGPMWMVIRLFVTLSVTAILLVFVKNLLTFYYPFYIEKRLKKLRYKPRISPKSGEPMKLLSEEEEDVYLDEGMQAEEDVFSIDYDVWIDEESGYTKIEKYAGHLHATQCPDCKYQTYKIVREEIITKPTPTIEGELTKYFECGYCGLKDAKNFKIAPQKEFDTFSSTAPAS